MPTGPLAQLAAVAFGWTHASNGIEGGTALAVLVGWGTYWALADGRSFPQPSDLGWL